MGMISFFNAKQDFFGDLARDVLIQNRPYLPRKLHRSPFGRIRIFPSLDRGKDSYHGTVGTRHTDRIRD
jgi:hypothetical protein